MVAFGNLWRSIPSRVLSGFVILGFSWAQIGRLNLSRPEFSSLVISGEQNPTHLYEQAHDRVGNHCGQKGENHLSATFCSFLLGRVCLEKGNRCPGERNQQANHGTNYRVGQTDKSGNDGDDYVGTRLAHLLLFIHSKKNFMFCRTIRRAESRSHVCVQLLHGTNCAMYYFLNYSSLF